jgi:hypothetical protein
MVTYLDGRSAITVGGSGCWRSGVHDEDDLRFSMIGGCCRM